MVNVLFICSKNRWRSPTAEKIYQGYPCINTRSAGTSSKADRRIASSDIAWADLIIVMESRHKQRLKADFPESTRYKQIIVLEIEDKYQYMDPALVEEIRYSVDSILKEYL